MADPDKSSLTPTNSLPSHTCCVRDPLVDVPVAKVVVAIDVG